MASQAVEDHPKYKQLKEERDFFERKYLQLKKEYEEHLASCKDTSDDDTVDFEPPAKIQRLFPSTDPFVALDPELVDIILTYLTPKELLTAMEVSKTWKIFIESRNSRMKRIMDNIVVKFKSKTLGGMEKAELEEILANKRGYKHMKADFVLPLFTFIFPFINFASTLESLEIACISLDVEAPEGVNFPNLSKLMIIYNEADRDLRYNSLMNFIKTSSFPEVTHLEIFEFDNKETSLNEFIEKFPKLKVFYVLFDPTVTYGWDFYVPYKSFENQPKIEAICIDVPYENLLVGFKDTLTELCIRINDIDSIPSSLAKLEKLQYLIIEHLKNANEDMEFLQHQSLKNLSILRLDEFNDEDRENFHQFLRSFPALQTLKVPFVYEGLIALLASNMANLKKLVCKEVSHEAMELYLSLNEHEDEYVNTTFELVIETDDTKFEEDFHDRHFK